MNTEKMYICTNNVEDANFLKEIIIKLNRIPYYNYNYSLDYKETNRKLFKDNIKKSDIIVVVISSNDSDSRNKDWIKEYNYARLMLKPIIVLVKKDIEILPYQFIFKNKISKKYLIKYWKDLNELENKFLYALINLISENKKTDYSSKTKYNYNNIDAYQEKLENILGLDQANENTDVIGLMINNLSEIRQFYILTKEQAQNSYVLAKGSCIAGICIIIFAIVIGIMPNNDQIAIGTTIGGIIVEVLAGTSLFVYQKTLKQLNYYYASLHNNERFLSLINIVGKTSIKDELYSKIVESELDNLKQYEIKNDNTQ